MLSFVYPLVHFPQPGILFPGVAFLPPLPILGCIFLARCIANRAAIRCTTASDVSMSLTFTNRTGRTDRWTAHHLNHALRTRGIEPGPIGTSAGAGATKAMVTRLVRPARIGMRWVREVVAP